MNELAVVLPGILSLFGAWFGARIALGRFKGERAFDRRVEWYERTLTVITELQWIAQRTVYYEERNNPEEAKATWARLGEQLPALVSTFAQRELYAKAKGLTAVELAELEINKLGDLTHALNQLGVGGVRREMATALVGDLESARRVLASELRGELYPERWARFRKRGRPEKVPQLRP